jgi:hypothetical protein
MKIFGSVTIAIMLFTAQCAIAYPEVGDYGRYVGTLTLADGTNQPMVIEAELTAYDEATKQFTYREVTKTGEETVTTEEFLAADEIVDQSFIRDLVANCGARGGTPTSTEVLSGKYEACVFKVEHDGNTMVNTLGDVPFASLVSATTFKDGSHLYWQIESVKFGK